MRCVALLLAGLLTLASGCSAEPVRAARGFYIATRNLRGAADLPAAATVRQPGVDGISIFLSWRDIEPKDGQYDWTAFDAVVREATSAGRKIAFGVRTGSVSPPWLADLGVPHADFTMSRKRCRVVSLPLPWDDRYIDRYLRLMEALRDRLATLKALDRVAIVKISPISLTTLELRLPHNNQCSQAADQQWASLGYRPSRLLAAWMRAAEGLDRLFPHSVIVQPILRGESFPGVDDAGRLVPAGQVNLAGRIIDRCIDRLGARCGIQWNALKPGGDLAERVVQARNRGATIGWQTNLFEGPDQGAGCQDDRRAATVRCTATSYTALLRRGLDLGATFVEVWEPDVVRYPGALTQAATRWKR